jgi:hypothetical protein
VALAIGLAYGVSALPIAEALMSHGKRCAAHLIIDAFQDRFHDAGWKAIETAGPGDVCSLVRERTQLALSRLLGEGLVADPAFSMAATSTTTSLSISSTCERSFDRVG